MAGARLYTTASEHNANHNININDPIEIVGTTAAVIAHLFDDLTFCLFDIKYNVNAVKKLR